MRRRRGIGEYSRGNLLVGALILVFLLLGVFFESRNRRCLSVNQVRFGDLGTWIAGIGTVLAVVVALWTATADRRASARLRRTSIFAWMEVKEDPEDRKPYWAIIIQNNTGPPIFDWSIDSSLGDLHLCQDDVGPIVPGEREYLVELDEVPDQAGARSLEICFRSDDGDVWMRGADGSVVRGKTIPRCLGKERD